MVLSFATLCFQNTLEPFCYHQFDGNFFIDFDSIKNVVSPDSVTNWRYFARTYLQLPLQQLGAGNVYLLALSSWKINIAENPFAILGCKYVQAITWLELKALYDK